MVYLSSLCVFGSQHYCFGTAFTAKKQKQLFSLRGSKILTYTTYTWPNCKHNNITLNIKHLELITLCFHLRIDWRPKSKKLKFSPGTSFSHHKSFLSLKSLIKNLSIYYPLCIFMVLQGSAGAFLSARWRKAKEKPRPHIIRSHLQYVAIWHPQSIQKCTFLDCGGIWILNFCLIH